MVVFLRPSPLRPAEKARFHLLNYSNGIIWRFLIWIWINSCSGFYVIELPVLSGWVIRVIYEARIR